MRLDRIRLYLIIFIACLAGYIWLFFNLSNNNTANHENHSVEVCLFKIATNIPCPSCGTTRSIVSLIHGNPIQALQINPIGYLVALIMIVSPIWILIDVITNKKTVFDFYQKTEIILRKPLFALPLIFLILINWIWNITKGL